MGARLKERMEDLIPRLHAHLRDIMSSISEIDGLRVASEYEFGVPMQSLLVGRGNNSRRDDKLVAALNEALAENGFASHPPQRGDAPYAFVYTEENRRDVGQLLKRKEVMLRINTNNPAMLADHFEAIGLRAVEIAGAMGNDRGQVGGWGMSR